ncbi:MAG: alpha/beta hydrolase [Actinomycetes bacterium]|nr:MAG: alpha/beta hydrolase [Actinomycetes bacterium]
MATYALVPGAWHGAWCWARVAPLLTGAGHRVVAVDLPCESTSLGCLGYRDIVLDAIGDAEDDLIVVGHSAGGLTAPLVAAAREVRRLVLVSALLPLPGRPFTEQDEAEGILEHEYQAGVEQDENGNRRWFDRDLCGRTMYSGCSAEDVDWAFSHLRPQSSTMYTEASPLAHWPDAPITDIRGDDDRLVSPTWAERAVPERLGIASAVIQGAGHSSMLSHPRALADLLLAA